MDKNWVGVLKAVIVASILSAVPTARASQTPQPASELNQLLFFEGSWSCRVKPTDSPEIEEFTWDVQRTLNGFWYTATVQSQQASRSTTIQHEFLGYDTAAKKLLRTFVTDKGNLINMNSSGWRANKLVWEGVVVTKGQKIPLRETITRKTATEFAATWAVSKTEGQWTLISGETCKKLG